MVNHVEHYRVIMLKDLLVVLHRFVYVHHRIRTGLEMKQAVVCLIFKTKSYQRNTDLFS